MTRLPLLLLALRDPDRILAFNMKEWDLLMRQAASANLTPSLLALIEERKLLPQVPPHAQKLFEWVRPLAARHRQAVRFEVACIQEALQPSGVPLLLLKGAAYTMAGLHAGKGRLFSDIDIMVPKARLDDVESALMVHGWAATHHDAYDQRYYREWMHELPPMQHVRRQSSIDVHHAIVPETATQRPDPAKLQAAAMLIPGNSTNTPPLRMLAPRDMVLHSAVHLFSEGEFSHGLRNLYDIHQLLVEFSRQDDFWRGLAARAHELKLARPLFYALRYATRLLGTPVPEEVMRDADAGRPPTVLLAMMDRLFLRVFMPPHPACAGAFTPVAHSMLYVRGNWLRMPPFLLLRHLFHKAFLSPDAKPAH